MNIYELLNGYIYYWITNMHIYNELFLRYDYFINV